MVFKLTQNFTNIWATIVRKFAINNCEKSPNLVTLLISFFYLKSSMALPFRGKNIDSVTCEEKYTTFFLSKEQNSFTTKLFPLFLATVSFGHRT